MAAWIALALLACLRGAIRAAREEGTRPRRAFSQAQGTRRPNWSKVQGIDPCRTGCSRKFGRRTELRGVETPGPGSSPLDRDETAISIAGPSTVSAGELRVRAAGLVSSEEQNASRRGPAGTAGARTILALCALLAALPINASERCRACHPDEVDAYLRSGMGRSISRPDSRQPTGIYYHGHSGTMFRVELSERGMVHHIERGGLEASYLIDYVIGSGKAALGYLVRVGDAVFQSPVTYYTELETWGMAPGMERYSDPDFTRPATADCLWCHAGRPRPVAASVNRYRVPPFDAEAISCDRCHGRAEAHLESPRASTIFNPAKAPPRERDSVCEQCHLSGLVRVLNPGQTFGSFEPGRRLEEYWSVFIGGSEGAAGQRRFQVVSHVEQLALSRCAEQSGEQLWCGTCHDPHSPPGVAAAELSRRCMSCHEQALDVDHAELANDCITCHMPKRQSHDSGHSAFTDHRIARRPMPHANPVQPQQLRPWKPQEGPLGLRNLGIAIIRLGQDEAVANSIEEGVNLLKQAALHYERDASILEALGTGLVLAGAPRNGLRALQRAVQLAPKRALFRNSLAAAWWDIGRRRESIAQIERAIRREPLLESSYYLLARVHAATGNPNSTRAAWNRLLENRPRLILPRQRVALRSVD